MNIVRNYLVRGVLWYLRFFARIALFLNRPYVIGVAGSVGKSSTRNALYAMLKDSASTKVITGNSETGVPLGILGLKITTYTPKEWFRMLLRAPLRIFNLKGLHYLIVEMGIDDPFPPKNMSYLLSIVKPDMSISLNISATHTLQFEKLLVGKKVKNPTEFLLQKIAEEDTKIITKSHCKIGIYNADNPYIAECIADFARKNTSTQLVPFGSKKENIVKYNGYEVTTKKCKHSFIVTTSKGVKEIEIQFSRFLLPEASRESLAAVIAAGIKLNLTLASIKESIEKNYSLPKSRASIFEGLNDSMIIDSSYNSSKQSVLTFLDLLAKLKEKTNRPIAFIMGDMRELGVAAAEEHEEVARKIVPIVDYLYCLGPLTTQYVAPIVREAVNNNRRKSTPVHVDVFKSPIQLGLHVKNEIPKGAIILIKGSQNEIFLEEAIKFLLLNPLDAKDLCRQDEYWQNAKASYFAVKTNPGPSSTSK